MFAETGSTRLPFPKEEVPKEEVPRSTETDQAGGSRPSGMRALTDGRNAGLPRVNEVAFRLRMRRHDKGAIAIASTVLHLRQFLHRAVHGFRRKKILCGLGNEHYVC
jgi:hypothetical protein